MSIYVVLLRAIGPATHGVMSMAQWREAVLAEGFIAPATYVATGNMIVEGAGSTAEVAERMDAIVQRLGLKPSNKAVVRTPEELAMLVADNPFPETTGTRPTEVGVHFFAEEAPQFGWLSEHQGPELIHATGRHLIIDYGGRAAVSGLGAMVERRSGVATARNWNTVLALTQRSAAREQ